MVESVEVGESGDIQSLLILEQLRSEEVAQNPFLTLQWLLGLMVTCKTIISKESVQLDTNPTVS